MNLLFEKTPLFLAWKREKKCYFWVEKRKAIKCVFMKKRENMSFVKKKLKM